MTPTSGSISTRKVLPPLHTTSISIGCCLRRPSAGGSPYYVVSILDMMAAIKPKISTTALGLTASSATLLLVRLSALA